MDFLKKEEDRWKKYWDSDEDPLQPIEGNDKSSLYYQNKNHANYLNDIKNRKAELQQKISNLDRDEAQARGNRPSLKKR